MTGQVYTFKYEREDECEVDVEVVINPNNPPTADGIKDLLNEMVDELYPSIVNISEGQ